MAPAKDTFQPDYVAPPGWILEEMLDAREMSQAEFARRCGRSAKLVSEIVSGRAPIEPETALQFEKVLGMDASVWLNMEANYQLHEARTIEAAQLETGKVWYKTFPVLELVKRNLIAKPKNDTEGVRNLLSFFGVASIDAWEERFCGAGVAYRHSPTFESSDEALTTWLRQGELKAEKQECANYNEGQFRQALKYIRSLSTSAPDTFLPEMQRACNEAGVAFVVVPGMPKTSLSGAARWATPRKAVIQQSVRHLVNDHFWFTFFHEAAHLLLHSKRDIFVDDKNIDGTDIEDEANSWARSFLVAGVDWKAFKASGPRSKREIQAFARKQGVAPGIIVGMLQHDGIVPWTHLNGLKQRYKWNDA